MHLTCPTCSAGYVIDPARWPHEAGPDDQPQPKPARARCNACGHLWLATPEPVIALDTPVEDVADEQHRRRWPLVVAALALPSAAAVALLTANAGLWQPEDYRLPTPDSLRAHIAEIRLPEIRLPTIRVPQIRLPEVKLPAPALPPLSVKADAVKRNFGARGAVWEVSGEVRNPSADRHPVPPLEVVMLDAAGRELSRWTIRPDADMLAPGESARFETSAINPPSTAEQVKVRLKPPGLARL